MTEFKETYVFHLLVKRILVLAPHPDDCEFACGASIRRLTDEGAEVFYISFSPCKISLPAGVTVEQLYQEQKNACNHLGITPDRIINHDFPVREFPAFRQEILETLVQIKKELSPDLVFLPNSKDIHQDHHVIYEEGVRAFKHSRLLGYELPWNSFEFHSNFHVRLEPRHLEAKLLAIGEYKSQQFRNYYDREFFFGLAKVRGVQIGASYAEAYEAIRWWL